MSTSTIRVLMGVINSALLNHVEGDARDESIEASRQIDTLLTEIDRQRTQPPAVTDEWAEQWDLMVECAKWKLEDYGALDRNGRGILYADSLIKALQGEGER